jgi:hypothetical protein
MLSGHGAIISLPETHFFANAVSRHRVARLMGLASRRAHRALDALPADPSWCRKRYYPRSLRANAKEFVRRLDAVATTMGAVGWVEKTPRHIRHLGLIRRLFTADHRLTPLPRPAGT